MSVLDADELQDIHGAVDRVSFFLHDAFGSKECAKQAGSRAAMGTDHDVFHACHTAKEAYILKGPRNSQGRYLMRLHSGYVSVMKDYRPFRGLKHARDTVKKSGFPRAIRADDAHDPLAFDTHVDPVERLETAKMFSQVFRFEQKHTKVESKRKKTMKTTEMFTFLPSLTVPAV
jgi:hypothetical protein